jgi:hypothetical protein
VVIAGICGRGLSTLLRSGVLAYNTAVRASSLLVGLLVLASVACNAVVAQGSPTSVRQPASMAVRDFQPGQRVELTSPSGLSYVVPRGAQNVYDGYYGIAVEFALAGGLTPAEMDHLVSVGAGQYLQEGGRGTVVRTQIAASYNCVGLPGFDGDGRYTQYDFAYVRAHCPEKTSRTIANVDLDWGQASSYRVWVATINLRPV